MTNRLLELYRSFLLIFIIFCCETVFAGSFSQCRDILNKVSKPTWQPSAQIFFRPLEGNNYFLSSSNLNSRHLVLISERAIQILEKEENSPHYDVHSVLRFQKQLGGVDVSLDGDLMAYGIDDHLSLYDIKKQKIVWEVPNYRSAFADFLKGLQFLNVPSNQKNQILMLKFSPDQKYLLVGAVQNREKSLVSVVEVATGKLLHQIAVPHRFPIVRIYFDQDQEHFYFFSDKLFKGRLSRGNIVESYDNLKVAPQIDLTFHQMGWSTAHMALSTDARFAYSREKTGPFSKVIKKVDRETQTRELSMTLPKDDDLEDQSRFYGFLLDPKDRFLLAEIYNSRGFYYRLFDTTTGEPLQVIDASVIPHLQPGDRLLWSTDGNSLIHLDRTHSLLTIYPIFEPK